MAASGSDPAVLLYHHFSLVMNRRRQLAYYTAVNIDGAKSRNPSRSGDRWYFDPRIAQSEQIGEDLYRRNDLDRGHLVRRLDPAWGSSREALAANNDTFHFTNCSPQHANFNQNDETWQGIENFLLGKATAQRRRLVIFTGPVMADDDPLYRGVRLPLFFWKIAVFTKADDTVSASAYLLDQTELIEQEIGLERFDASSFQIEIREIVERTGIDFGYLEGNESPLERAPGLERADGFARVPLGSVLDIHV
jgi:endonuclease G, mitochondrial